MSHFFVLIYKCPCIIFRLKEEAGEALNLVVDRYNAAKQAAKTQLQKAKSLSNGFTPADDGYDEFRLRSKSLGSMNDYFILTRQSYYFFDNRSI